MDKGYTINVLDDIGFVRYIDHMGSDERICEFARVSYRAPSKGVEQDKKLIDYLWKNRHTSPFEAVKITLNLKMPMFIMRQYVRHRMQNLNEVSARYTELPNNFYVPTEWRKQDTKNKQGSLIESNWNPILYTLYDTGGIGGGGPPIEYSATELVNKLCDDAYELYKLMIDAGIAREQARMVLPVNIYTEIYCCWDLKNLLHFITLRDDSHAQAEIQSYGKAIGKIVEELFPYTWAAYKKYKWVLSEE